MAAATGLLAAAGASAGDGSPLFRKARDFYAAGQYDSTIVLIREHLRKNGRDPESYTLVPLVAEAYMRRDEHAQVHRLIDLYRQNFADAPFIPRLTYLEGVAYAKEASPSQALTSFSAALELGVSADLFSLTLANVESICGRSLSADELSSLSSKGQLHAVLLEIVRFYEIQKLAASGQTVRARNSAEEFVRLYPRSRYAEQVKGLLGKLAKEQQKGGAGHVQVGLLAPMTGEDSEIGRIILQGVKLALDAHNARAHNPLKLIVYDTKGNAVETARKSKELLSKDQAHLCIGPVLSNTAAVSAAMFADKDIVMITPTANEDGISSIGDNIFQMNVSLGAMAQKLARYAVDNLNIRDFAIIAPNSAFGYAMADAFKEELGRHSIMVVHEEYFNEGTHDFTSVLKRLRYALLRRRLDEIAAERGFGRIAQISRGDSLRYADSSFAVGGLFMPLLDYQDVVKLAPQAVFHRIRTQMLGTGGWNDPRVPSEGKRYVSNAIISVGVQPDQESEEWKHFGAAYRARYNDAPNRIAAMGYDAAQLVIKIVNETGGADTGKLKKALSSVQDYNGLSGKISFDPQTGANDGIVIMKVTETGFMRVH